MLVIRFQRIGKKGQAYFRIVATEHTKKPKGEFLELLGSYDPHKKVLICKKDRIQHWISMGAQLSPTVNNLLINKEIITGNKTQSWKPKVKEKVEDPAEKPVEEEKTPETEEQPA